MSFEEGGWRRLAASSTADTDAIARKATQTGMESIMVGSRSSEDFQPRRFTICTAMFRDPFIARLQGRVFVWPGTTAAGSRAEGWNALVTVVTVNQDGVR